MKIFKRIIIVGLMIAVLIHLKATTIYAEQLSYKNEYVAENDRFSTDLEQLSYRKIVRTYSELKKLKKEIKSNYVHPQKYLKKLNNYKKKFFMKKAIIFVSEAVDVNGKEYVLNNIEKKDEKVVVNIDKASTVAEGVSITTVIDYDTNTYIFEVKKKKIKKIKKVKVKYSTKDNT